MNILLQYHHLEINAYQKVLETYQTLEPDLDSVSEANKAFRKATYPYTGG